jgi:hypothetical protein
MHLRGACDESARRADTRTTFIFFTCKLARRVASFGATRKYQNLALSIRQLCAARGSLWRGAQ